MPIIHSLPVITNHGGRAITTSRDVAAFFGKRHSDVFRAIKKLVSETGTCGRHHYGKSLWISPDRRAFWQYEMDRDGFMLLAASFTGPGSVSLKATYLAAFSQIEEAMRSTAAVTRVHLQQGTVKSLCGTEGGIWLSQTAHVFNVKESRLIKMLRYGGWIYRCGKGFAAKKPKCNSGLLKRDFFTHANDEYGQELWEQLVLVTPKGLEQLAYFFDLKIAA